jgi:hypothetical protein
MAGNPLHGAELPPALAGGHYEHLFARWTMLRTSGGYELAERDAELLHGARAVWGYHFTLSAVIQRRLKLGDHEANNPSGCFCGGFGYSPVWAAEAREQGLRAETYASAWGWQPVWCVYCRVGAGLQLDEHGAPEGPSCWLCRGTGVAPEWTGHVCGGPAGPDDQTSNGWFPSFCRRCGGWGRILPCAVEEPADSDAVLLAVDAVSPVAADAITSSPSDDAAMPPTGSIAPPAPSDEDVWSEPTFERRGKMWFVTYLGRTVPLRDRVGHLYLQCLVQRPGEAVDAMALIALRSPSAGTAGGARRWDDGLVVRQGADLGTTIDERALAVYKARHAEQAAEIAIAEQANDLGRLEKLRAEHELLGHEILAAVDKNGRLRQQKPDQTRARDSVQKAISDALHDIDEAFPELAEHLRKSMTFGSTPAYRPAQRLSAEPARETKSRSRDS